MNTIVGVQDSSCGVALQARNLYTLAPRLPMTTLASPHRLYLSSTLFTPSDPLVKQLALFRSNPPSSCPLHAKPGPHQTANLPCGSSPA